MSKEKILILGVSGMLGHILYAKLADQKNYEVYGTVRELSKLKSYFNQEKLKNIIDKVDAENIQNVVSILKKIKPKIVINCIGVIKQSPRAEEYPTSIAINSMFPHNLALACQNLKIKVIHISTDCVFDGQKGNYLETDIATANDIYGKSKFLGELHYKNSLTLRTSIIGHELSTKYGLVEWFISQNQKVKGYAKAIYTGFPTIEFANIIIKYILPNDNLTGLYQVSSNPISKYELLKLITKVYKKEINIEADDKIYIDRSLDSSLFKKITKFKPLDWPIMIRNMYNDFVKQRRSYEKIV